MEMCPYCGEEVPEDAVKCWKCDAVLQEAADGALEAEGQAATGPTLEPCPHCEAPQPPGAHRCRECGRIINERQAASSQARWILGSWAVFAAVGLVVLAVLAAAIMSRRPVEKRVYKSIVYRSLAERYSPERLVSTKSKAADRWEREYRGRHVRWRGVVERVTGRVALVRMGEGKASHLVQVEFEEQEGQELGALAPNQAVSYDARLIRYNDGEHRFVLDRGRISTGE
jgi:ribosomal protein L40E